MSFNINDWIECTKLYVVRDSPDQFNIFTAPPSPTVYFNAVDAGSVKNHNLWQTLDLTPIVPSDCKAACFSGFLIITHGINPETCNLQVFFRRDSSVTRGFNYIFQCVEASASNGQRSTASCWVPLTTQKTLQWKWKAGATDPNQSTPVYQYPYYSAYGANLRVVACAA